VGALHYKDNVRPRYQIGSQWRIGVVVRSRRSDFSIWMIAKYAFGGGAAKPIATANEQDVFHLVHITTDEVTLLPRRLKQKAPAFPPGLSNAP